MNEEDLSRFHIDGEFVDWPRRPTIMTMSAFFLFATMGVTALPWLSRLLHSAWPKVGAGAFSRYGSAAFQVLVLLLPVLVHRSRHPGVDSALRLRPPKLSALLIAVAAAGVGVVLSSDLGTLWLVLLQKLGMRAAPQAAYALDGPWAVPSALLLGALLPAVCEEMLFRGAILGAWERRGTVRALYISSLLFALLHGSFVGFPIQLLLGFVLGYLAINADSLYVAMAYHFVHNAGVILLAAYTETAPPGLDEGLYAMIGGMAGVLLCALRALILLMVFAVLLIAASSEREKSGRAFERPGPVDMEPLGWRELIVLTSGVVTMCMAMLSGMIGAMWSA